MKINCPVSENWVLNKAVKYVKNNCSDKFSDVVAILSCRTPLLKVQHNATKMLCDITVASKLGLCNTQMMSL